MPFLEEILIGRFLVFTLVLARVSGLILVAPIYGGADVPIRIRALLAVAMALLITPTQPGYPLSAQETLVGYVLIQCNELLIGIVLGLGIKILFTGIQVTGQIVSQLSGTSLADVYQPGVGANVPVFGQFLYYVTMAVFVLSGGHRLVMAALLDTFGALPPGTAGLSSSYVETITSLLTQSFVLGIGAAAPAMTALLVATLLLGFVSRTMPQINILAVGFGINSMIGLGALFLSLGTISWLFQDEIESVLELIRGSLVTGAV